MPVTSSQTGLPPLSRTEVALGATLGLVALICPLSTQTLTVEPLIVKLVLLCVAEMLPAVTLEPPPGTTVCADAGATISSAASRMLRIKFMPWALRYRS